MSAKVRRDYSADAASLFSAFAERHQLSFVEEEDAPIEVMWSFPKQDRLSYGITLGLQNNDELNFGIDGYFWSYFFPFPDTAEQFAQLLDSWMMGDEKLVLTGRISRELHVRRGDTWQIVYRADRWWPFGGRPKKVITNLDNPSPVGEDTKP